MKIGFMDYYLDEFHANNYPRWIRNALKDGETVEFYAWAEMDSPKGGLTTDQWCAKYGATRLPSMQDVCRTCDFLFLLSPDDPQNHLPYAKVIFPYGKPVFVDKTFAPDAATAREIIALAQQYHTPFFSSSSLRFASEYQAQKGKARTVVAQGSGCEYDVEIIHPIEICAFLMGCGATEVMANGDPEQVMLFLRYQDGRHATVQFTIHCADLEYGAVVDWGEDKKFFAATSDFFQLLTNSIMEFFRNPACVPVTHEDTLEGIRIRDGVYQAMKAPYTWIRLS